MYKEEAYDSSDADSDISLEYDSGDMYQRNKYHCTSCTLTRFEILWSKICVYMEYSIWD